MAEPNDDFNCEKPEMKQRPQLEYYSHLLFGLALFNLMCTAVKQSKKRTKKCHGNAKRKFKRKRKTIVPINISFHALPQIIVPSLSQSPFKKAPQTDIAVSHYRYERVDMYVCKQFKFGT